MKSSHEIALNQLTDRSKLTRLHWRIWFLSAMGVFLDGFDLFLIGVALPLIEYQWHVTGRTQCNGNRAGRGREVA